ncbi:MAG TPA: AMP-binding protein [Burkholderiales bacterium]|nr:AMP-binding protein [Burkholderiales bacterium]
MTPLETLQLYPAHDGSLAGLVASRAARNGDKPFILFEGRTISWREIEPVVRRAAAAYSALGVKHGDRVATYAPTRPEIVITLFALARLGAWMVPVNPELRVEEVRYILAHAGVCGIACARELAAPALEALSNAQPAPWRILLEPAGADGMPALAELAAQATPLAATRGGADDVCIVVYTSGTTGFPKGVMHSQRNMVLAGEGFVERMRLVPEDRLIAVLPLFHINALFYSLCGAAACGGSIVLVPKFSASRFWQVAAETGATEFNFIAAISSILAQRPRSEFVPHRITKAYGAPISAAIDRTFREEFGVKVMLEGYGMTEIPGACNNPFPGAGLGEMRLGAMGKAARHPDHSMPFAELRVIDDAGRDLPAGETGELAVRTPMIMKGYYRDPDATKAAFIDGWFLTGDLVKRDADGYFWFVARKKDIIRRRGENISGAELDRVIGEHPAVAEAAAIAVPSPLGEDDILVAVVLRPGMQASAQDVADWCRTRLAAHKVPRYVAFVTELPHTPTHRIAKFKLKGDKTLAERAVDLGG